MRSPLLSLDVSTVCLSRAYSFGPRGYRWPYEKLLKMDAMCIKASWVLMASYRALKDMRTIRGSDSGLAKTLE